MLWRFSIKKKTILNLNKNNKTDIKFHTGASLASTGEPCFTKRLCPCSKVVDISTQLLCIWISFLLLISLFLFLIHEETLLQGSWSRNKTYLHLDYFHFFFLSFYFCFQKRLCPFSKEVEHPTQLFWNWIFCRVNTQQGIFLAAICISRWLWVISHFALSSPKNWPVGKKLPFTAAYFSS